MNKLLVYAACLIGLTGLAMAGQVTVSPSSYSFSMVAGSNYTQEVTVEWNGDQQQTFTPETVIEGKDTSSEGLSVTYSSDRVELSDGETEKVNVTIVSSERLKPDDFSVETKFSTDVQTSDSGGGGSSYYIDSEEQENNLTDNSTGTGDSNDSGSGDDREENDTSTVNPPPPLDNNNTGNTTQPGENPEQNNGSKIVIAVLALIGVIWLAAVHYREELLEKIQEWGENGEEQKEDK